MEKNIHVMIIGYGVIHSEIIHTLASSNHGCVIHAPVMEQEHLSEPMSIPHIEIILRKRCNQECFASRDQLPYQYQQNKHQKRAWRKQQHIKHKFIKDARKAHP